MARWLWMGIGAVIVLALGTWAMNATILPYVAFTDTLPVHNGCSAFYQRVSPYDDSVTRATQDLIQARASGYDRTRDEHRFAYPLHLCVLLAPLWALPYDTAAPLWMFVNFLGFAGVGVAYAHGVMGWRARTLSLALLTLGTLAGWRYSLIVVVLAQYVGLTLFAFVGALWAWRARREGVLAVCLMLMTVRAESALLAGVLVAGALLARRWRVLAMWSALMFAMWLVPTLWLGQEWVGVFLRRVGEYGAYNTFSATWTPLKVGDVGVILFALFSVLAGALIWRAWRDGAWLTWGMAGVALWQLMALPQTNRYTLVYALPALILTAYGLRARPRAVWGVFVLGGVFVWAYGFVPSALPNDQVSLPLLLMPAFVWGYWEARIKA